MSYLPKENMIILKTNIKDRLVCNRNINIDELLDDIGCPKDVFSRMINVKSNREISPEIYQYIEVFCIKNNIDTEDFCGDIPAEYGNRLKFFMFKHYLNQSEFSRRTLIPTSTLYDMIVGKIRISNKYKEKMCKVLSEDEFDKLSSYGDITIPETTDVTIINGCNFSWNFYKNSPKFISYAKLFKEIKVDEYAVNDISRFAAGNIKLTKPKLKAVAKYLKCNEEDLTKDSLNLYNLRNRFGYWFATKLYELHNSIKMFADRCGLDPEYIADIIKGESLIRDEDIENIANHLNVDPKGLLKICPKQNMELLPISEENMSLNEIVRYRISNLGYTFKEFCDIMDINSSTMASSLHKGRLPKKNREDVIKELDLQDRFPEEVKPFTPLKDMLEENFGKGLTADQQKDEIRVINTGITGKTYTPEPFTPIKDTMEENFNKLHPVTTQNQYGFAGYVEPYDKVREAITKTKEETTVASTEDDTVTISMLEEEIMDFYDIENVLSMMDNADYEKQISLTKFICMLTGKKFTENLSSESISGKLDRLNLIRNSIK